MARRQKVRRTLIISFLLLFPVTFNYYSPALPIMGTLSGVAGFSLLFWTAWLLASLVLGRSGCGYACPLAGLQETWDNALDRRLRRARYVRAIKYVIFAGWVGTIAWAAFRSGGWHRVDLLYMTENFVSWDRVGAVAVYGGMFGLVMLLCLPFGRRAFCHYLCWWSPLNIIGTKVGRAFRLPSLHLESDPSRCKDCRTCDRVCTMSLPVSTMVASGDMTDTECILCGTCADNCQGGAIRYAFGRRGGVQDR